MTARKALRLMRKAFPESYVSAREEISFFRGEIDEHFFWLYSSGPEGMNISGIGKKASESEIRKTIEWMKKEFAK